MVGEDVMGGALGTSVGAEVEGAEDDEEDVEEDEEDVEEDEVNLTRHLFIYVILFV